jgi:hypothetical protein
MNDTALKLAALPAAVATARPTYDEEIDTARDRLPECIPGETRDELAARAVVFGQDVRSLMRHALRQGLERDRCLPPHVARALSDTRPEPQGAGEVVIMYQGSTYHLHQSPRQFDRFSGDGLTLQAEIDPDRLLRWKLRPSAPLRGLRHRLEAHAAPLGVWESFDAAEGALMPPGWDDMAG